MAAAAEDTLAPLPPVPADAPDREQGIYADLLVPLYDMNKQQVGSHTLAGDIFDVPVRRDILHRVVRWSLAAAQQGTHKTKTRSEVRGGGRKPRPQKGSGNSRQGTIRAPQWRGGGIVHGPVPRSHAHKLPKRVRRLGLQCALSAKAWEGRLLVLDSLRPEEPKTVGRAGLMHGEQAGTLLRGRALTVQGPGSPMLSPMLVPSPPVLSSPPAPPALAA